MYDDPRHLRDREIKLRVDEATYELISALARFHRTQKAVYVRDLVESQLELLAGDTTEEQAVA